MYSRGRLRDPENYYYDDYYYDYVIITNGILQTKLCYNITYYMYTLCHSILQCCTVPFSCTILPKTTIIMITKGLLGPKRPKSTKPPKKADNQTANNYYYYYYYYNIIIVIICMTIIIIISIITTIIIIIIIIVIIIIIIIIIIRSRQDKWWLKDTVGPEGRGGPGQISY